MKTYRLCKSASLYVETTPSSSGSDLTDEVVLAAQGKVVCLHSFSASSSPLGNSNTSLTYSSPAYLYIEKMDSGNTELLKMPLDNNVGTVNAYGDTSFAQNTLHIPGPGLFSGDGMRARIEVPAAAGSGSVNVGISNLVYSA